MGAHPMLDAYSVGHRAFWAWPTVRPCFHSLVWDVSLSKQKDNFQFLVAVGFDFW